MNIRVYIYIYIKTQNGLGNNYFKVLNKRKSFNFCTYLIITNCSNPYLATTQNVNASVPYRMCVLLHEGWRVLGEALINNINTRLFYFILCLATYILYRVCCIAIHVYVVLLETFDFFMFRQCREDRRKPIQITGDPAARKEF
jgi:hypothetical protein